MKKSKFIISILGLIIFIYLIYRIGLDEIILTFKDFNFLYLPLILLILIISHFLAGVNLWILVKRFKKVSFFNCIKYNFFTVFYSTFMPGKLADFFIIYYFKQDKVKIGESSAIIFFDKIISLIIKSILGILGAFFLLKKFDLLFFGIPLIIILVIVLLITILFSNRFRNFIKKHFLRKYLYLLKGFFKNIKIYLKSYKKELFYNFLVTLIKDLVETLSIYILFMAFGLNIDFITVLLIFNLLAIINFVALPIGVSGLGAREALGVIVFGLAGIDNAVVLNTYIVRLVLIYLINLLIFMRYSSELNLLKKNKIFKRIKSKIKG